MFHFQELNKKIMNCNPEFGAVAFAFIIACMIWTSPVLFLRDNALGKIVMVASVIVMTMYHRIAGIITLIAIITILNQTPIKEGMTNANASDSSSSTPSISFESPVEFRQKYCLKGIPDDPTPGKMIMTYMLNPSFFTKMDASGNPTLTKDQLAAFGKMDSTSFNECTPFTYANGNVQHESINNLCDPKCNWKMKPVPTTTPTTMPTVAPDAADAAVAANNGDDNATEGFTPMLRPHIRTGRHLITNGINNAKSSVNRAKRQLF